MCVCVCASAAAAVHTGETSASVCCRFWWRRCQVVMTPLCLLPAALGHVAHCLLTKCALAFELDASSRFDTADELGGTVEEASEAAE